MIKIYFMNNIIKVSKDLLGAFTIIFIIFATYSCSTLPGMNGEPKAQKGSKKITGQYSINDITIDIIDVNKLTEDQIENYNNSKVKELKYSINEFPTIYNYKYEYALGSSDVISINLTKFFFFFYLDFKYTVPQYWHVICFYYQSYNKLQGAR